MLVFAAISPHPLILLPTVGPERGRLLTKKTIKGLENLGRRLRWTKPDSIIISSPHPDWGFNVPLYFLAPYFEGKIKKILANAETAEFYFEEGKKAYSTLKKNKKYALVASGDLSHCLKQDGPYGFHPDGPAFDQTLIDSLKKKNIKTILDLNKKFPEAGECGLRSFCFILGILEGAEISWQIDIISYEAPFGVGYLVADLSPASD